MASTRSRPYEAIKSTLYHAQFIARDINALKYKSLKKINNQP